MEQNTVVASLDLMHEIIVPPAISFWPLAPGWYALAWILLAYLFHLSLKIWARYRANTYRRAALYELACLEKKENESELEYLLTLMKRVAIQHFGRKKAAALSNTVWWEFVEQHSQVKVDHYLRRLIQEKLYSSEVRVKTQDLEKIRSITKLWIKTHGALDD